MVRNRPYFLVVFRAMRASQTLVWWLAPAADRIDAAAALQDRTFFSKACCETGLNKAIIPSFAKIHRPAEAGPMDITR
jgi:hypothetical protein